MQKIRLRQPIVTLVLLSMMTATFTNLPYQSALASEDGVATPMAATGNAKTEATPPTVTSADESQVNESAQTAASNGAEPELYQVKVVHGTRCTINGTMQPYDLYVPEGDSTHKQGHYPLVVLVHGFMMTAGQHSANAKFLAERGFIVFTPNISKFLWGEDKRTRNVEDLVDSLSWLTGHSGEQPVAVAGLIDTSDVGVAGNSSGGGVALELALQAQKAGVPVKALISLEGVPWDRTLSKLHEMTPLKVLTLRAEPCRCNYHDRMLTFLKQLPFQFDDVKVNGARHCDVENPTTFGCTVVCGATNSEHRLAFQNLLYLYFRDALSAPKIAESRQTFLQFVEEMKSEHKVIASTNRQLTHI